MATRSKQGTEEVVDQTTGEIVEVAGAGLPAAFDYGADAGGGFENQTADDYSVPFIALLQSKSKEVEKEDSVLRAGMLMLTDTKEAFDGKKGLLFVPATTQHVINIWTPRDKGGGLVERLLPGDPKAEAAYAKAGTRFGKIQDEDGNEVVDTFNIFGQLVSEDDFEPLGMAVIGCNSTKIGPYQGLMKRLRTHQIKDGNGRKVKPPMFAYVIRVTTESETRKGQKNFNFRFHAAVGDDLGKSMLPPNHPAYIAARMVRDKVDAGQLKASTEGEAHGAAPDEDADPTHTF